MKNILVFPCGTDEGLELNRALGQAVHFRLYGAGKAGDDRGKYIYRNYIGEWDLGLPDLLRRINDTIERYAIDLIYPASAEALLFLARHRNQLAAPVMAPDLSVVELCQSERRMRALFEDLLSSTNEDAIKRCFCLTDRHGTLRFVGAEGGAGAGPYEEWAKAIHSRIKLRGAWSFSVGCNRIRVRPGIVPSMAVYRNQGVNLPALALFDWLGHDIEIKETGIGISSRLVPQRRYVFHYDYDDVYLDLDDTIIIDGQVNPLMMAFLFQCRNRGKKVHLITKHRFDLDSTLKEHRLSGLFDSVFWLKASDEKYRYMKEEKAIFIDDAYSERKKVSERLGIPTFEVSAVECLMDWRL